MAKRTSTIKRETTFAAEVIHSLRDFADAVKSGERLTLRKMTLDLEPRHYSKSDVASLRKKMGVSQAVFAELLAVSVDLVQKWELGTRRPQPVHCRLLDEVSRDPTAWMKRLIRAAETKPKRRAG